VLGSSDGKANQVFSLLRTPALPGVQVAVREPDRPPSNELEQLQEELGQEEAEAQALLDTTRQPPARGYGSAGIKWRTSTFPTPTAAILPLTQSAARFALATAAGAKSRQWVETTSEH
jgi:hypothetical protein